MSKEVRSHTVQMTKKTDSQITSLEMGELTTNRNSAGRQEIRLQGEGLRSPTENKQSLSIYSEPENQQPAETKQPTPQLGTLPDDVLGEAMEFLQPADMTHVKQTSQQLNASVKNSPAYKFYKPWLQTWSRFVDDFLALRLLLSEVVISLRLNRHIHGSLSIHLGWSIQQLQPTVLVRDEDRYRRRELEAAARLAASSNWNKLPYMKAQLKIINQAVSNNDFAAAHQALNSFCREVGVLRIILEGRQIDSINKKAQLKGPCFYIAVSLLLGLGVGAGFKALNHEKEELAVVMGVCAVFGLGTLLVHKILTHAEYQTNQRRLDKARSILLRLSTEIAQVHQSLDELENAVLQRQTSRHASKIDRAPGATNIAAAQASWPEENLDIEMEDEETFSPQSHLTDFFSDRNAHRLAPAAPAILSLTTGVEAEPEEDDGSGLISSP